MLFLYQPVSSYDKDAVHKHVGPETPHILDKVLLALNELDNWNSESLNTLIKDIVKDMGVKFHQEAQPLRIAVSGSVSTPSIDVTLGLVGRDRAIERIQQARESFSKST